jgi:hypothetical protein
MRALITGCAQNCSHWLPAVLANVEQLRSLCQESRVLLLENDSNDNTVARLRAYSNSSSQVHALGFPGLNARIPIKTVRLAHLRNTALAWLEQHGGWGSIDLLVVLDLDGVNADPWDLNQLQAALQWWQRQPNAAGLFANQMGPYYDLWALRHPQLCPDDVWAAMLRRHGEQPELSDEELLEAVYEPRQFSLGRDQPPLEVESAFGGLAFYSAAWLARSRARYGGEEPLSWQGPKGQRWLRWQCCEHVALHRQLRAVGGRLWIHPQLINWQSHRAQGLGMRPNPSGWRHLALG